MEKTIYSAQSVIRDKNGIMRLLIGNWARAGGLGYQLALRDIKAKYRQTFFGFIWIFVPVAITTALFVFMNKFNIINVNETELPYFLFAFIGTLLWQTFSDAIINPIATFTQSKQMIAKIQFPKEALIISAAITTVFQFVAKLVVVLPIILFMGYGQTPTLLLFPFVMIALMSIGLFFGLILAPLNLLYNDVMLIVQSMLMLLIFTVPVGYKPPDGSALQRINDLNPLSFLIETGRSWLTTGSDFAWSSLGGVFAIIAIFAVLYILGFAVIRVILPIITERISA